MSPQDLPLADIHLPQQVGFWPPAPGWWLLLALIIVAIIVAISQYRKYKALRRQQKIAIEALNEIDLKTPAAWQQINEVLKRAALAYCPREQVAPLAGERWKLFLQQSMTGQNIQFDDNWLHAAYSDKVDQHSIYQFHSYAQLWLKNALPIKQEAK